MKDERKVLIGGIVSLALIYLVPTYMGYIWIALFSALIGAGVYLVLLYKMGKKNYREASSGRTTIILFSLLLISSVVIFSFDYYKADYQRDILREVRITIDSSIIEAEVRTELLEVYREYMLENQKSERSVLEVAVDFFGDRLEENNKFLVKTIELEEDLNFSYKKDQASNSFSIYVTAELSQSWSKDFKNRDGSEGLFQTKTTLSSEGVTHERQN